MEQLNIPDKFKKMLATFAGSLKDIYHDNLVSLILYGSAASGEFISKYSNLNLLVILKCTDIEELKKASRVISKFKFISPLFMTEDYVIRSTDTFPIEFLDMQENYYLLFGKDVLKDININTRNLRFQCEQELKAKLIGLRQAYLRAPGNTVTLPTLLFKSFNSVLHILRNILRLKGKKPPYQKQDILKMLALEFNIKIDVWQDILAAKNKQPKLINTKTGILFVNFTRELEKIVDIVDRL